MRLWVGSVVFLCAQGVPRAVVAGLGKGRQPRLAADVVWGEGLLPLGTSDQCKSSCASFAS